MSPAARITLLLIFISPCQEGELFNKFYVRTMTFSGLLNIETGHPKHICVSKRIGNMYRLKSFNYVIHERRRQLSK